MDARALYDGDGNLLLIYGFTDQKTLVITTSRGAFTTLADVLK